MNKEEILAASRRENRDKDVAELELARRAQFIGGITSVMVAFVLLGAEFLVRGEKGYGYMLIVFASNMALWIYRAIMKRKKADIFLAVLWTAMTVYTVIMYVGKLLG